MNAVEHVTRYLYSLAGGVALYTVGPFVPRHRRLLSEVARHFGYRAPGFPDCRLPEVPLEEAAPDDVEFRLLEPEARDGNVTLYELVAIARIVRHVRPAAAFEIGTFNGRTTLNIAANAAPEATTHTLDLPADQLEGAALPLDAADLTFVRKASSGDLFAGTALSSRIVQHWGDSATFDFGPHGDAVDLVFVDGAHSYEYVLSDSDRALGMLRGGRGVVLWHDYGGWEGVTRALNELHARGGRYAGLKRIRGTSLAYLRLE
jgi:predicted O-methyltransferase YrrM